MVQSSTYISRFAALALTAAVLVSCGEDKFKVDGTVAGAKDAPLVIERAGSTGSWTAIDSTRTDGSGHFSIKIVSPGAADIYRIEYNGQYVYFPVDSTEHITVTTSAAGFGRGHRLSGSDNAVNMARFDSTLNALGDNPSASALETFKRQAYTAYIMPGRGNVVSYYILTKTIGGKPLFDPADPADAKYYAAVATAFEQYKPDDPRTAMLKEISLKALSRVASAKGQKRVIKAREITSFDIRLPDTEGNMRSLNDVIGKGKPVLLTFTMLTAQGAPAYNAELKKIYDSGRADIFMVSLDPDRYEWRDAAVNLPWTNVYEQEGGNSKTLVNYNVTTVPVTFIFNAAGELTDRADTAGEIAGKL